MTTVCCFLPSVSPASWPFRNDKVAGRQGLQDTGLRLTHGGNRIKRREMQGLRSHLGLTWNRSQNYTKQAAKSLSKLDTSLIFPTTVSSCSWSPVSPKNQRTSHTRKAIAGNADNMSQTGNVETAEAVANSATEQEEEPRTVDGDIGVDSSGVKEDFQSDNQEKSSFSSAISTATESLKETLARLPPVANLGISLLGVLAAGVLTWNIIQNTILSPRFLMYASWFFIIWPWPAALALGAWTLRTALKQKDKKAKEWEQFLLLGGTLTWLILVPCGHFQGFVDGWPLALFCIYYLFFCISAIVRLRLYGELSPREADKQWSTKTSKLAQIGFVLSVVGGHWLAAKEALLTRTPLPWSSSLAWFLLGSSIILHWQSTFFLGKYFDRLVVPKTVVTFGPYRWIRHPIYSSYMLLFAGYCVALQSFYTLLFLVSACALYYAHRVSLEEELLVENFGGLYEDYRMKVTKKFVPYIV